MSIAVPVLPRFFVLYLLILFYLPISCIPADENKVAIGEGKQLAKKKCTTCHMEVDPSMLTKRVWLDFVLPAMSKQFGLELWSKNSYLQTEKSTITYEDWMKIVKYYEALAPDSLPATDTKKLSQSWRIFGMRQPVFDSILPATTLMVAAHPSEGTIFTSDAESLTLTKWSSDLHPMQTARLPSPATHILFPAHVTDPYMVTCIGGMKALDITKGDVFPLNPKNLNITTTNPLVSGLIRPVETVSGDFNKDGLTDYLISAFGHTRGGLYLMQQKPDKNFQKILVREIPGALQSTVGDFNRDGWPDIITLFAHGNEGIWLFMNDKKGGFTSKNLLTFPPVYGSSSFQLVDFDKDGKSDILYTAGDNSDYSKILKPFHGVYIFTNTGDFTFRQSFFYPVNGCTKAVARDFDQDGDLDIVSIAFFADLKNNPGEKFLYFEQNLGKFEPQSIPVQQYGRWICMDVADVDGDSDDDIVLGNYSKGLINQENVKADWNVHIPFIVLENKTADAKKRAN